MYNIFNLKATTKTDWRQHCNKSALLLKLFTVPNYTSSHETTVKIIACCCFIFLLSVYPLFLMRAYTVHWSVFFNLFFNSFNFHFFHSEQFSLIAQYWRWTVWSVQQPASIESEYRKFGACSFCPIIRYHAIIVFDYNWIDDIGTEYPFRIESGCSFSWILKCVYVYILSHLIFFALSKELNCVWLNEYSDWTQLIHNFWSRRPNAECAMGYANAIPPLIFQYSHS